ncbi:MAG TPA: ABC transporter substrate-binding protein [Thermodesulfobacteriota bacterium]
MRRIQVLLGFAPLLVAALWSTTVVGQGQREVVVMSWGGDYERKMAELIGPAFEKATGYRISYVTAGSSAEMVARVKAQADRPQIDVVICDEGPQLVGGELWQPIEASYLTNMSQMYDLARVPENRRVRPFAGAVTLLYNTKVFAEKGWAPPTSWNDLWDPRYKGHVITPEGTSPYAYGLTVIAARLEGGGERNLEPGWSRMKSLAPAIPVFATPASKFGDLFRQGTGWIGVASEGSALRHRKAGLPIGTAFPREGALFVPASAAVVDGGPNPDGAKKFVNHLLTPEVQRIWAESFGWAPLNRHVDLPADIAAQLTFGAERVARLQQVDWDEYNRVLPEFLDRWNREIASR